MLHLNPDPQSVHTDELIKYLMHGLAECSRQSTGITITVSRFSIHIAHPLEGQRLRSSENKHT
jgi:hypothetical protein